MTANDSSAFVKKRHRISQRQRRWLFAYLTKAAKWNATEAARVAGYKWPNHSGPENLQKLRAHIDRAVDARLDDHDPEIIKAWVWQL